MGDAEGLARQAVEEIAGDRLARREGDRVHEAVELRASAPRCGEQSLDLGVVGDVAVEHQIGAELARRSR